MRKSRRTTRSRAARRPTTAAAYLERVNLAIDYITAHLHRPIKLAHVARAAAFSPHHFHRVFQSLTGETIADFTKRARLDRALMMMTHHRRASIADISDACGFTSPSDFSRSFKQRFGASPRAFDLGAWRKVHGARVDATLPDEAKALHVRALPPGANPDNFAVRIRDLPARTVAYIRVADPFKPDAAKAGVERLMAWAESHGVIDNQWLGYMWERPDLVALEQCAYYAAVVVPSLFHFTPRGEIGRFRFPPMTVAEVEVRGTLDLELRALRWLFGSWLPRSGYVPDDQPCFEHWIGRPFAHGDSYFELHAHLPVRRKLEIRYTLLMSIDTKAVTDRRTLHFNALADMRGDLASLEAAHRAGTLRATGNWTPAQIFNHLAAFINYPYDGYPPELGSPPWFVRVMVRLMKNTFLHKPLPAGFRIPKIPGGTIGATDAPFDTALATLRRAVDRLDAAPPTVPNPVFGPLTPDEWRALHLRHAELHLGFLHTR